MFQRNLPFSFLSTRTVAAAVAAVALSVAVSSEAMASTVVRHASVGHRIGNATSTTTDLSAAHRRHYAHRGSASARAAYGSVISEPAYGYSAYPAYPGYRDGGYPGFGYGIGDNSNSYTN